MRDRGLSSQASIRKQAVRSAQKPFDLGAHILWRRAIRRRLPGQCECIDTGSGWQSAAEHGQTQHGDDPDSRRQGPHVPISSVSVLWWQAVATNKAKPARTKEAALVFMSCRLSAMTRRFKGAREAAEVRSSQASDLRILRSGRAGQKKIAGEP